MSGLDLVWGSGYGTSKQWVRETAQVQPRVASMLLINVTLVKKTDAERGSRSED